MTNAALSVAVGPTVQRLKRVGGSEVVTPSVDREVSRKAWRIVSPVETMRNAGKIPHELWMAYDQFDADWNKAAAQPSLIARYGERAGSGGTPIEHMTDRAILAAEARDSSKALAVSRVNAALMALVVPRHKQAIMLSVAGEGGLEEIGREISRYTDRGKAIAVAMSTIEDALWLLRHHYVNLHGQSQIAT